MALQLWTMNSDGTNKEQVTKNHAANFGPSFFPKNDRIIFSSNMHDEKGRDFDLYAIDANGENLERITCQHIIDSNYNNYAKKIHLYQYPC